MVNIVVHYALWFGAVISIICAIYVALIERSKLQARIIERQNPKEN